MAEVFAMDDQRLPGTVAYLKGKKSPCDLARPAWARWKAKNADGAWHWFECRPKWNRGLGIWTSTKGESEPA